MEDDGRKASTAEPRHEESGAILVRVVVGNIEEIQPARSFGVGCSDRQFQVASGRIEFEASLGEQGHAIFDCVENRRFGFVQGGALRCEVNGASFLRRRKVLSLGAQLFERMCLER